MTFVQAKKSPHKHAGKQQVEGSNPGNYGFLKEVLSCLSQPSAIRNFILQKTELNEKTFKGCSSVWGNDTQWLIFLQTRKI
ncbi:MULTISPECIES: hypothetical protein [unclassified Pseudoalteromonas]|uniref:hypothetical protein n=1 Tax=unclassified Pseudoalteromonas TaxID=194690 RepID=UPI00094F9F8D|nr:MULTISPECIES: hypothetical protein [unclassified Pseudoalteromonas]